MKFACFFHLYLKIFEKSPFLMKTPSQNFAHHTEVKKHPFGVKTPNLATLVYFLFVYFVQHSAIQAATAISVFNSFKSETAPFPAQKNQNPPPIFTIKK